MDEKQRQSHLDKLRQEQAANEDAFDQIAIAIARADIPISKDPAGSPTPQERAATPADWIDNYAEGMARAGKCSQEEAAQGIRSAFENRYDMSPEDYAEQFTPQKSSEDKSAYWALTDPEKDGFTLYVGGEARASAWDLLNVALVDQGQGRPELYVNLPFSQVIFDAVESELDIDKPAPFREHAALSPDYRSTATESAAAFREKHPGSKETRHYLETAVKHLNDHEREHGKLREPAAAARDHIGSALENLEKQGRLTPEAQAHIRDAQRCLRSGEIHSEHEGDALRFCEKAAATLPLDKSQHRDDAIARAIEKVKAKEEDEQQRGRGEGRERD